MLRRYWLSVITLVGLILAAQQAAQAQGSHGGATQPKRTPQTQAQPTVAPALQDSLNRIGTALEAANNKSESAQEAERAKQNLDAQIVMARSANRMFYVGLGELVITFAGVMLVLATLLYTKKAAEAARDAVVETEKATKAARDIGEAQVRAYLSVETSAMRILAGTLNCWPKFKNTGQSPATNIEIMVDIRVWPSLPSSSKSYEARDITGKVPPVAAGNSDVASFRVTPSELGAPDDLFDGEDVHVSVQGTVRWHDVFGKEQALGLRLVQNELSAAKEQSGVIWRIGDMHAINQALPTVEEMANFERDMAEIWEPE